MNIYSKIDPTTVLHIINRKRDIQPGRVDLVEPEEMLQCAVMRYNSGQTFKPHKHHYKSLEHESLTQESWCVIQGMVQVILYDIDDSILHTDVLEQGDISITIGQAGHNYVIMNDNTIIAEYKSGPYYGQEQDKKFIY